MHARSAARSFKQRLRWVRLQNLGTQFAPAFDPDGGHLTAPEKTAMSSPSVPGICQAFLLTWVPGEKKTGCLFRHAVIYMAYKCMAAFLLAKSSLFAGHEMDCR